MILLFAVYLTIILVFALLLNRFHKKFSNFSKMQLKRNGIVFNSKKVHRIKILNCDFEIGDKKLFLIYTSKVVKIENINVKYIENGYLYFKALGLVLIKFDCKKFYRYFNFKIESSDFQIETIKQHAILGLIESNFDVKCEPMKKYLTAIIENLNITIDDEKVVIKKNQLGFSYILKYKVGSVLKIVKVV